MSESSHERIRQSQLAGKWYPEKAAEVKKEILSWEPYISASENKRTIGTRGQNQVMTIVPHAGWFFSGRLAASTLKAALELFGQKGPEAVVILGGHLPKGAPTVSFTEDAWDTPLAPVTLAPNMNAALAKNLGTSVQLVSWEGRTNDNTIEVLLPLIKYYFPHAAILALRAAPDQSALILAKALLQLFKDKKTLYVASTDLTHYGYGYGFAPAGVGAKGEKYREKNDRFFIQAALELNSKELLDLGNYNMAACSAGAASVCSEIAALLGASGVLVDYYSSTDILPGEQSVGYAGILYAED
ncbi:MAG: AmmeMemoRadiSam system protein B [Deltaproteobacteria bacterium]|nr:AmmeMemoRadiSam system protein B [Deltaproteobacteria bacterium]